MKRLFALGLALLVLTGCGTQGVNTPGATTPQNNQETLYIPDSTVEKATGGAVRAYNLPSDDTQWIAMVGNHLLLAGGTGFTVLSGENGVVVNTVTPEFSMDKSQNLCQFITKGMAYYDAATNEAVYLDQLVKLTNRVALPETVEGMPIFSQDGGAIYYCAGNEIRVFDTTRNITRPVKSQLVKEQSLIQSFFDGKVLSCRVVHEDGREGIVYLDAKTGETLSTDSSASVLDTHAETYFAMGKDGALRQEIFGNMEGTPAALEISDDAQLLPALALGGIMSAAKNKENGTTITRYNLSTGTISAQVSLPGVDEVLSSCVDKNEKCLWLLVNAAGIKQLYRWNPENSETSNDVSYLTTLFTPENPDTEGLAACQTRVEELNKTYQLDIRIWSDAVEETGEHAVVAEHRPASINSVLDQLETALEIFPEKFLQKSAGKPLRICVVRSVNGGTESVQFYKSSYSYIFLPVSNSIRDELIRGVGYVVNSRVVGNTSLLDTWTELNPEGFQYGQGKEEYISGDNRAFADLRAMESVVDDRSSIFRFAMTEGNEAVFESEIMQKKLSLLCQGIRKVWKWKKEPVSYPWEQYLKESLAYNGK